MAASDRPDWRNAPVLDRIFSLLAQLAGRDIGRTTGVACSGSRTENSRMPFIITDPCIETKDTACVDVCPVDCIHPRKDEAEFAQATMLYIHPEECIDCGACVPACPVAAIYESIDATPSNQKDLIEANAIYRNGDAETMARAEEIVKAHVAAQPALMAIPAAERQAAHASH
jgi:NAD-dependent dihydropyrimidine dehydrogenase PreA subunit